MTSLNLRKLVPAAAAAAAAGLLPAAQREEEGGVHVCSSVQREREPQYWAASEGRGEWWLWAKELQAEKDHKERTTTW